MEAFVLLEFKRITKASPDRRAMKAIYLEAFPREERAPWFLIIRRTAQPPGDFWGLYDKSDPVGMAYVINGAGASYLFYFAIRSDCRGRGYGSEALERLKELYAGSRLFLALEQLDPTAENYAQRVKRHAFYEKHGLTDLPYRLKEASMVYSLMSAGGTVYPQDYRELIDRYTGPVVKRFYEMRFLEEEV